jgi:hypothetical protein
MKHIETVIADPSRFLKHGGCYARTPKAAVAVLAEMARDSEDLRSVWIDCDTNWCGEVVDLLLDVRQEGGFPGVVVNLYGELSARYVLPLERGGYEAFVHDVRDHQTADRGDLSIAAR